jgi:hypothetical protein
MKGIESFNVKEMGLFALAGVAEFGPLVLIRFGQPSSASQYESAYYPYRFDSAFELESSSSSDSSGSDSSDREDDATIRKGRVVGHISSSKYEFSSAFTDPLPPSEAWRHLATQLEARNWNNMQYLLRRTYDVACNWKVFVDNYCDGGYHVQQYVLCQSTRH